MTDIQIPQVPQVPQVPTSTTVADEAPAPLAAGLRWVLPAVWLLAGSALVAIGSLWDLWYLPFLAAFAIGVRTGAQGVRARAAACWAVVPAVAGWTVPLLWRAAEGEPVAATAAAVAALAGLPPAAALLIAVTLLVPLLQALTGVWLGRSVMAAARPGRRNSGS